MKCAVVFFMFLGSFLSEVWANENFRGSFESNNDNDSGDILSFTKDSPFWKKLSGDRSESGDRSFQSDPSEFNLNNDNSEDKKKMTLQEFLLLYAKPNKKPSQTSVDVPHDSDIITDDMGETGKLKDKSKSWTLVDVQKHNHPFEDKKGWVSLEPIPWSVSKISKWQSKYKPSSDRPWDDSGPISSQRPYTPDDDFDYQRPVSITPPSPYVYHKKPTESTDRYDPYYDQIDKPRPTASPSVYPRPTAFFGHKVQVEAHFPSNSYSGSTGRPYHNQKDCNHPNHPYDEIMTDGRPADFPESNSYDFLRRRGTEMQMHPETHPSSGDGEWVLLSTTKGYKPPRKGQRSLVIDNSTDSTQAMRTTRGVRLTVLPPLKGSKVNMTTSHGGLLQVESTFESVEQAKQKFDKKQNRLKIKAKRKRRKGAKKTIKPAEETYHQTIATVPRTGSDPGALMAAVGAGMIPATMAMMVPIAMTGG